MATGREPPDWWISATARTARSQRSAPTGSIPSARRAGAYDNAMAIAMTTAAVTAYAIHSYGRIASI